MSPLAAASGPGPVRVYRNVARLQRRDRLRAVRLVVIDLDVPKPGDDPPPDWVLATSGVRDGQDVLAMLAEQAGQALPAETYTVATTSGGRGLGWKIDTRAHGVVAAVSVSRKSRVLVGALRAGSRGHCSSPSWVPFPSPADMAQITLEGSW
jgi:hypothetical protein